MVVILMLDESEQGLAIRKLCIQSIKILLSLVSLLSWAACIFWPWRYHMEDKFLRMFSGYCMALGNGSR